jgi:hypothetical protein
MSMLLTPEGNLAVAGTRGGHLALALYSDSGSLLHATFVAGAADPWLNPRGLARLPDGSFVVGGPAWGFDGLTCARFDESGELDLTFGEEGFATSGVSGEADGVFPDALGGVMLVGWRYDLMDEHDRVAFLRFRDDGRIDDAFAEGGVFVDTSLAARVHDAAEQPSGAKLVVGYDRIAGPPNQAILLRYVPE